MLQPWDTHNQRLAAKVAPSGWLAPVPKGKYHLLVIGGGPAGLVAAAGAAGLGARVALVEKHLLGGDCLNVGCVPSKALLAAARVAAQARRAMDYGVQTGAVSVDFPRVMERMRGLRADMARHDSAARFRDLGVDVFLGEGRFTGADCFEIDGRTLTFARACIATGARASLPPIPGMENIEVLTNENLFNLTDLPKRLAVIGAGPVGCEMSQAFARFGSAVTLIEVADRILSKDHAEAAALVAKALAAEGVALHTGVKQLRAARTTEGASVSFDAAGVAHAIEADAVLVAAGRVPNVEGLGLEAAGVKYTPRGVQVDDHLRTSNPRIFAAGDVASAFAFTHAADAQARIVIQNALFLGRTKASALTIPWCTYTSPEVAGIGKSAEALEKEGTPFSTHRVAMADLDRAVLDGETEGFLEVRTDPRGKILGASAVSAHAGDLIGEVCLAMTHGLTMGQVSRAWHPYPTHAEAFRKAGDAFNRTRLTPFTKKLLGLLLRRLG